jgi:uncharacterized RDD family membrane protein YckC
MISPTMAVAAMGNVSVQRSEDARHARPLRLIALVLDLFFLVLLNLVINIGLGTTQIASGTPPTGGDGTYQYTTVTAIAWPFQLLLAVAYYAVLEGLFGATLGKSLAGVCVVRVDGRPLALRDVVVRNVVRLIDWLPFIYIFGGALVVFSTNSQRLGDLAARTTVVMRIDAGEPGATRDTGPRGRRIAGALLGVAVVGLLGFNYFGRPAQLIDAMYTEGQMPIRNSGYTLGTPRWAWDHVTYPISGSQGGTPPSECIGSITFVWHWFSWTQAGADFACGVHD